MKPFLLQKRQVCIQSLGSDCDRVIAVGLDIMIHQNGHLVIVGGWYLQLPLQACL
jgi:hypothetical protein